MAYLIQLYINKNTVFKKDFKICLYHNNKKIVSGLINSYSDLGSNKK
jgi:hypothetical protein